MKIRNSFFSGSRFGRNDSGSLGIVIAIVLPLLLGVLLLSVDLNINQTVSIKQKNAVDAAALAAAEFVLKYKISKIAENPTGWENETIPPGEVRQYALGAYSSNFQNGQNLAKMSGAIEDFEVTVGNESVTVRTCTFVDTKAISKRAQQICAESEAGWRNTKSSTTTGSDNNVLVAFSLDVTYSMIGMIGGISKIERLKSALGGLINSYFSDDPHSKSYGAIVPFTYVSIFDPFDNIFQATDLKVEYLVKNVYHSYYSKPFYDLTWQNYNVILPAGGTPGHTLMRSVNDLTITSHRTASETESVSNNFVRELQEPPEGSYIQPLTNNRTLLKTHADSLSAFGNRTHGLSGLFNAWLILSPAYQHIWNSKRSVIEDYGGESRRPLGSDYTSAKKIIVHISDGGDNMVSGFRDIFGTKRRAEVYRDVCSRIKAQGVEIYAIAYGYSSVAQHLQACTEGQDDSIVPHFFNNVTPSELGQKLTSILEIQTADLKRVQLLR